MPGRERATKHSVVTSDVIKRPLFLLGFVTVVIAVLFAGVELHQKQVNAPWNELLNEKTRATAKMLAEQLETRLIEIDQRLLAITKDPTLRATLTSNDYSQLDAIKSRLLSAWPELNGLIIAPRRFAERDIGDNFIAIDLLSRANAGEQVLPVAGRIGQDWSAHLCRAVVDDQDQTIGSVLVSLPIDVVTDTINDQHSGRIEIRQLTQRFAPQTLWFSGGEAGDPEHSLTLESNPAWQLRYSAPPSLRGDTAKALHPFLASVTGLFLLAGVLLWLLYLGIKQALVKSTRIFDRSTIEPGDLSPEDLNTLIQEQRTIREQRTDPKIIEVKQASAAITSHATNHEDFPVSVFRDYDIRGRANSQINDAFAMALGKTLGTHAVETSRTDLVIAMDGRISSPALKQALSAGILATGCNVIDLGLVPTPAFNFGLQTLDGVSSGVIVTASHNPAGDNGFKLIREQNPLTSKELAGLALAMNKANWVEGEGALSTLDIEAGYIDAIARDVSLSRPFKLVIDCGNGAMGSIAPRALETLGCEVTRLNCDIDGSFPNHDPDPSEPRNLKDLISIVLHQQADLGLAFDGDGDRVVAISAKGRIIWPDELVMIFARDILGRQPGARVVFDVKSTRRLPDLIRAYGGEPIECKTGHSNLRRKIRETDAILGGEYSGHIFFNDRWFGFDDGLYAAARLLEILDAREQSLDDIVASFESSVATPEIKLVVNEKDKFLLMEKIAAEAVFDNGLISDLDGLRVTFDKGWGLIRASNTSACLTLRFEADDQEALARIQDCFKTQINRIVPDIKLPL